MANVTARQIGKSIRKLSLRAGDIILVDRNVVNETFMPEFLAGVKALDIGKRVMVLFLDDMNAIRKLNDADMAKFGWLRANVAARLIPIRPEKRDNGRENEE